MKKVCIMAVIGVLLFGGVAIGGEWTTIVSPLTIQGVPCDQVRTEYHGGPFGKGVIGNNHVTQAIYYKDAKGDLHQVAQSQAQAVGMGYAVGTAVAQGASNG